MMIMIKGRQVLEKGPGEGESDSGTRCSIIPRRRPMVIGATVSLWASVSAITRVSVAVDDNG